MLNVVLIPVSPQNTTRSGHGGDVGVTLAGWSVTLTESVKGVGRIY